MQDKDGFALAVGANILCQRDHVCLDVFGIYSYVIRIKITFLSLNIGLSETF